MVLEELTVYYEDISKLRYNKYHNRLEIYGRHYRKCYTNYTKDLYNKEFVTEDSNSKLRLYLYYKSNGTILNALRRATGLPIIPVNKAEI